MSVISGIQTYFNLLVPESLPPLTEDLARVSFSCLPALYLRCYFDREFAHFVETRSDVFLTILQKYMVAIEALLNPQMIEQSKKIFRAEIIHVEFFQSEVEPLVLVAEGFSPHLEPLSESEVFLLVRNTAIKTLCLVSYLFATLSIPEIMEFFHFSEKILVRFSPGGCIAESIPSYQQGDADVGLSLFAEDDVPKLRLPKQLK